MNIYIKKANMINKIKKSFKFIIEILYPFVKKILYPRANKYKWNDNLSVSNSIIDNEHRNIINMINALEFIHYQEDTATFSAELDLLEKWIITHFCNEEFIASRIDFDFTSNKICHEHILNNYIEMKHKLKELHNEGNYIEITNYFDNLHSWLIKHIHEEDMLMKPFLEKYNYNFHSEPIYHNKVKKSLF